MKSPNLGELDVSSLGPCRYPSPLRERSECVDEQTGRVLVPSDTTQLRAFEDAAEALPSFESAGPRSKLFFEPAGLRCGIVTCGGLCPGLNDVVRSVVLTLTSSASLHGPRLGVGDRGLHMAPRHRDNRHLHRTRPEEGHTQRPHACGGHDDDDKTDDPFAHEETDAARLPVPLDERDGTDSLRQEFPTQGTCPTATGNVG